MRPSRGRSQEQFCVVHSGQLLESRLQQEWWSGRLSLFFNGTVVLQVDVTGLVSPRVPIDARMFQMPCCCDRFRGQSIQSWNNVDGRCVGTVLKSETSNPRPRWKNEVCMRWSIRVPRKLCVVGWWAPNEVERSVAASLPQPTTTHTNRKCYFFDSSLTGRQSLLTHLADHFKLKTNTPPWRCKYLRGGI